MILIVDDERAVLELVSSILAEADHQTLTFTHAEEALTWLESNEATLILSDVSMPTMSGFAFKQEFERRFPNRAIPFLFLSSHSEPQHIVHGLELGADDYLTKPAHPEVLRAKIGAVLRRQKRYSVPIFHGDIARFPFVKLLQFCETRGLTGEVAVQSGAFDTKVRFQGGELVYDERTEEALEQLIEMETGAFQIHALPVTFSEIEFASAVAEPTTAAASSPETKAMGQLSGVKVGARTFQIQTELVSHPESRVVTIVILDGRTVLKRVGDLLLPGSGSDPDSAPDYPGLIRTQHASVEAEVRDKLDQLGKQADKRSTQKVPSVKQQFNRLFEEGHDAYLSRDYEAALAVWEEANALDPDNKALSVNLDILKKKMASA